MLLLPCLCYSCKQKRQCGADVTQAILVQYRDGLSHGKGKLMLAGEGQYEGEFVQGKKDGRGIWMGPDDMVYDGQYRQDKRHGHGTLTIQDGSMYQGEWKEGKFDGQGVWTWRDGRRFEGLFSQDQPVEGILTFEGVSRAVTWDAKTGAFVSPEQARAGAADRGSPVGMAGSNDMMPSVGLWGLCTTARKEGMPLNSARTSKTGNTQDDEMPPLPVKEGWCPPGTSSYGRYEDSKRRFCAWTGLA